MHGTTQCLVGRIDGIAQLVDIAVQTFYISVGTRNGTDSVYQTGIGVVAVVHGADLTVCHGVEGELLVVVGELANAECLSVCIFTVQKTVHDNDIADGVEQALVGESVPTGLWDDALDAQTVQIQLDGIIGRSKAGVGSVCRHQLINRGFGNFADFLLLQQTHVFAELLVLGKIAGNGSFLEYIACRAVNCLGTTGGKNHAR